VVWPSAALVAMLKALFETRTLVSGSAFATLLYRRDVPTVTFLVGAVLNALLSKVLKRAINARRPEGARLSDPGMPSSHAQSLFFFGGFLACGAQQWALPTLLDDTPQRVVRCLRDCTSLGVELLALVLALLRVRAGLHTPAQIAVGGAIGTTNGVLWFVASPSLERAVLERTRASSERRTVALVGGLLVVGALVIGSAERVLARRLKRE